MSAVLEFGTNLQLLESYLASHTYLGSDRQVTLCDYRLCAQIHSEVFIAQDFPHLARWRQHVLFLMAASATFDRLGRPVPEGSMPELKAEGQGSTQMEASTNRKDDPASLEAADRAMLGDEEEPLFSLAARFTTYWVGFRGCFHFEGAEPAFVQLTSAGLTRFAAGILKDDPQIRDREELERVILRSLQGLRVPDDVKFFERTRAASAVKLFETFDVFDPWWKAPAAVSQTTRIKIADGIRVLYDECLAHGSYLTEHVLLHHQLGEEGRATRSCAFTGILESLREVLSSSLGRKVSLTPFGSSTYGLFDEKSDVDCFVHISGEQPTTAFTLVQAALEQQVHHGWRFRSVLAVNPVITVTNMQWSDLEVDLTFTSTLGLENSAFFQKLFRSDERTLAVLSFIKHCLRKRQLINPKDGYFSSYAYMTMALSVLTDLGVVPRLRSNFSKLTPRWVAACNVAHSEVPAGWSSANKLDVGDLVLQIFRAMTTPGRVFALTDPSELHQHGGAGDGSRKQVLHSIETMEVSQMAQQVQRPQKTAVVLCCAAPIIHWQRSVLQRVYEYFAPSYASAVVDIDLLQDELQIQTDGHRMMGNFVMRINSLLMVEQKRLLVCITSMNAEKLRRNMSGSLPPWVNIVVLQPVVEDQSPALWSLLRSLADPLEVEHRRRYRDHSTKKRSYLIVDEDLPSSEQPTMTKEQHERVSEVFRHAAGDLRRCLETEVKLRDVALRFNSQPRWLQLQQFWPQVPMPASTPWIERAVDRPAAPSSAQAPEVYRFLRELAAGSGLFGPEGGLRADEEAALDEIVSSLAPVLEDLLAM